MMRWGGVLDIAVVHLRKNVVGYLNFSCKAFILLCECAVFFRLHERKCPDLCSVRITVTSVRCLIRYGALSVFGGGTH